MSVTRRALHGRVWAEPMLRVAGHCGVSSSYMARARHEIVVMHRLGTPGFGRRFREVLQIRCPHSPASKSERSWGATASTSSGFCGACHPFGPVPEPTHTLIWASQVDWTRVPICAARCAHQLRRPRRNDRTLHPGVAAAHCNVRPPKIAHVIRSPVAQPAAQLLGRCGDADESGGGAVRRCCRIRPGTLSRVRIRHLSSRAGQGAILRSAPEARWVRTSEQARVVSHRSADIGRVKRLRRCGARSRKFMA